MKIIRVFIGTARHTLKYSVYSVTLMDEDSNIFSLETRKVSQCSLHKLILLAIIDTINQLNDPAIKNKYKFVFYPDNEKIAFEWNQEYLKENKFSESTEDKELYKKLINLIDKNKNEIIIKGKDSVLSSISKLGIKK